MSECWGKFICFDTETSGLHPSVHQVLTLDARVVEWAAAGWELTGKPFHGKVAFMDECEVDARALKVNRIDRNAWEGEKEILVLREFIRWAREEMGDTYSLGMGFNVSFDIGFLKAAFARHPSLKYTDALSHRGLDVMQMALWARVIGVVPETKDMKLTTLCDAMKIDTSGAHDSAVDVRLTFDLFKALYDALGGTPQGELFG